MLGTTLGFLSLSLVPSFNSSITSLYVVPSTTSAPSNKLNAELAISLSNPKSTSREVALVLLVFSYVIPDKGLPPILGSSLTTLGTE